MRISVNENLPDVVLRIKQDDQVLELGSAELFAGKKTVLFALPGAFTPTCSKSHLPGFVAKTDEFFNAGIDQIVCLSVNDAHVMSAWGEQHNAGAIKMIADGNADFTEAIGLELDRFAGGMGLRSRRYAMLIDNGIVRVLNIEKDGEFKVSDADTMLKAVNKI